MPVSGPWSYDGAKDLFSQEELSDSQLVAFINTPTQEEVPVALTCSQEVKEALWPVPLDLSEEVENSFQESLDEQEQPVYHLHFPSH